MDVSKMDVPDCPRCGEDHDEVEFWRLERPVAATMPALTHWGLCPSTGEPIMCFDAMERAAQSYVLELQYELKRLQDAEA